MIIESLQKDKHRRLAFTCRKEPLDRFLQESAHQALAKGLSETYVAVEEDDEAVILGYYTVTTCRIESGELPDTVAKKFKIPKHELPASLVARLAVSESFKGRALARSF